MTVSFFGHRQLYNQKEVSARLSDCIDELIKNGASTFLLGGYGDFDKLAASVLKKKKELAPQIRLILVLPYLDKKIDLPFQYDESIYPPLERVPKRYAIIKRNEWMIRQSDVVVIYCTLSYGGAASALRYAKKIEKPVREI